MSEKIVLVRTDQPDLAFMGELVASAAETSGPTVCVYSLYKTSGGTYIAAERESYFGEYEKSEAYELKHKDDVVEYFGYSEAAKTLYSRAGINAAEWVD